MYNNVENDLNVTHWTIASLVDSAFWCWCGRLSQKSVTLPSLSMVLASV
jgi:hypothetical protein